MIEAFSVSKSYGSIEALCDVSFHAEKGSITGLLGQNGAGKTTLLSILTGYLAPTKGHCLIDGYDPLLNPEEAKRYIGYLPEIPPLYDEMTVREYLYFVSELRGVAKAAIPSHVKEIMELTKITEMRQRMVGNLSKGYRQRAGIAQALCGDPEVIIMDEPTVGLDPKQVTEIRSLILSLRKEHTILFSSHILSEVQQLCDHVIILEKGKVCLDAPVREKDEIRLLCTVLGKTSLLQKELGKLEGLTLIEEQPSPKGHSSFLLGFRGVDQPEKELFRLMCALSCPILHLSRCEDDLETVFMNAISG